MGFEEEDAGDRLKREEESSLINAGTENGGTVKMCHYVGLLNQKCFGNECLGEKRRIHLSPVYTTTLKLG